MTVYQQSSLLGGVSLRRRSESTTIQQVTSGEWSSLPTSSLPVGLVPGNSEQVETEGVFSRDRRWRWSLSMARQGVDGEGATPQWMVMESFSRRYSWHLADGKGAVRRRDSRRIARDTGVHQPPILVLTSKRACSAAAKHQASVQQESESGTGWCGVSEVLGLSVVRAVSPKKLMYKCALICTE
jgi:hypothetical protein